MAECTNCADKMAELKARGNAFFKAKHYDDAIGSYTDAIAAAPPLGVAYSTDEQVNHSAQHAQWLQLTVCPLRRRLRFFTVIVRWRC